MEVSRGPSLNFAAFCDEQGRVTPTCTALLTSDYTGLFLHYSDPRSFVFIFTPSSGCHDVSYIPSGNEEPSSPRLAASGLPHFALGDPRGTGGLASIELLRCGAMGGFVSSPQTVPKAA